jgi:hypothetical protein
MDSSKVLKDAMMKTQSVEMGAAMNAKLKVDIGVLVVLLAASCLLTTVEMDLLTQANNAMTEISTMEMVVQVIVRDSQATIVLQLPQLAHQYALSQLFAETAYQTQINNVMTETE